MYIDRSRNALNSRLPMPSILIRGARTHNLRNIDLELPRDRLIVFTGLTYATMRKVWADAH